MFILILIYVCYILGVTFNNHNYGTNIDPDTLTTNGGGYVEIEQSKSPSGIYRGWYILIRVTQGGAFVEQYITYDNAAENSAIYWRRKYGNVWSAWQSFSFDIPSFYKNYADLSSLANALGAFKIMNDADADIDGLQSGNYRFDTAPTTNAPFSTNLFNLLCFNNNDRILQVAFRDNDIKYRIKWGSWNGWVSIAINS